MQHQYIERDTGCVETERLVADGLVNRIYSQARENAPFLFRLLTSPRLSSLLGFIQYDSPLRKNHGASLRMAHDLGIDLSECVDPPWSLDTPRKLFERKIRYWETRPMTCEAGAVVSPADAKVLPGSLSESSDLFLKGKFFAYEELLGESKTEWLEAFDGGDFAIFRLTPDKYHYNHVPVTGEVVDIYELPGGYHSCNPGAAITVATPYSKNKRVVTILDTDVLGGTGVGLVAMIEIVALMIGDIVQCYSDLRYEDPRPVTPGMLLLMGRPKSLYRPGSSTDVLLFQKGRVRFSEDLVANAFRADVQSRYSRGFGRPLVETEIKVRSTIGSARRMRMPHFQQAVGG
jgi:phosphatidylserine decarboxylase